MEPSVGRNRTSCLRGQGDQDALVVDSLGPDDMEMRQALRARESAYRYEGPLRAQYTVCQ
jgi:hypothetical protein